ncbi:riboflavin synthase, alpha subunit [Desulfurobacterium thermolithotrophum DSM 11699]|uniref:Riboflavin synthase n=1 Tax=Desulfurobacterium thermolithotrophum (strain DSM 11699 / BSA) TaxID=868864 RepID=F0S324_DESTD|nr:riboflavin synthase [Desulfurobacterium thermolithotrophum]ADY73246.1 riboflavin synthase, alpha subunit [Desulfurobacterium thermolithotrophum DSM 11699]
MFTGLVEEVGRVLSLKKSSQSAVLKIGCQKITEDIKIGDSISVNGVCLTVVSFEKDSVTFDVSAETLRRSNIGILKTNDFVNLERALRFSDRLGGHILQGHVDTITKVVGIKREGTGFLFSFKLPPAYRHLVVEKGSIGIDGISLTIATLFADTFSVAVIPHTYKNTTLKFRKPGDIVNLEFDIIGKYVEKMLRIQIGKRQ